MRRVTLFTYTVKWSKTYKKRRELCEQYDKWLTNTCAGVNLTHRTNGSSRQMFSASIGQRIGSNLITAVVSEFSPSLDANV
jgi:flavorubredoxin